jgi:hypothetical protein
MARLRDKTTGSIVVVDDDLAERLGESYEPESSKKTAKPAEKQADKK